MQQQGIQWNPITEEVVIVDPGTVCHTTALAVKPSINYGSIVSRSGENEIESSNCPPWSDEYGKRIVETNVTSSAIQEEINRKVWLKTCFTNSIRF
jgi:hypothetical protein